MSIGLPNPEQNSSPNLVPLLNRPEFRVLFVSHSFPREQEPPAVGGMQRVAVELHEVLQRVPGVSLRSLLLRSSRRWLWLQVVPYIVSLLWRIPADVRQARTDVVVFSSMVTALLAWPLRERMRSEGVKMGAIVHGLDVTSPNPVYQWMVRRALHSLDVVLPVSHSTASIVIARGAAADKVEVVPNGVSLRRFFPDLDDRHPGASGDGYGAPAPPDPQTFKLEARRELATRFDAPELLESGTTLVCSVGRQIKRKGFDWFTGEVMPLLPPDVYYWLAGDGPQADAILEAAERAGIEHRVRLLGTVDEQVLTTLLRAADLFAMPNRPTPNDPEGFGVVMLEAGLCGTPTVAASLEGIRDVVSNGLNGHLVESGNAQAFADTILQYHWDHVEMVELGRRALSYTVTKFDWSSVASNYAQVLSTYSLPSHEARSLAPVFDTSRRRSFPADFEPVPAWAAAPSPGGS